MPEIVISTIVSPVWGGMEVSVVLNGSTANTYFIPKDKYQPINNQHPQDVAGYIAELFQYRE